MAQQVLSAAVILSAVLIASGLILRGRYQSVSAAHGGLYVMVGITGDVRCCVLLTIAGWCKGRSGDCAVVYQHFGSAVGVRRSGIFSGSALVVGITGACP